MSRPQAISRPLLVLDSATRHPVVALADTNGTLLATRQWESRHRHGEELLQGVDGLLAESGVARRELAGVIVGTGPGSFTGLRIGLATAKVIAYSLGIPLVGVSSTHALAQAVAIKGDVAVTLPAGASDSYVHLIATRGETEIARLVGSPADLRAAVGGATRVAVDTGDDAAPSDAIERGHRAVAGLAAALAGLGAAALESGTIDDPARLVPAYVALPRGIARAAAEMEWSPDLR